MSQSRPHLHFTFIGDHSIFGEIIETYRLAAERLGYPTSYQSRLVINDTINIIFFVWSMGWEDFAYLHPRCIFVNFEPMVPGSHAYLPSYLELLEKAYVWEYSRTNLQRLDASPHRKTDWVPLCFEEQSAPSLPLTDTLAEDKKDFDVVFFGSRTQRRVDLLEALRAKGLKLAITMQPWSFEERADHLRRSKIALNFHNWDTSRVVEQSRLHILFRHHCAVVCELYPDSEIPETLRNAVAGAPYEDLIDTIMDLLNDEPRRLALQKAGWQALHQLPPQEQLMAPALDRYFDWLALQSPLPSVAQPMNQLAVHVDCAESSSLPVPQPALLTLTKSPKFESCTLVITDEMPATPSSTDGRSGRQPLRTIFPLGAGLAARRNYAIHQAQGRRYIAFADPAEEELIQRLQAQTAFLEAHPQIDIVACGHADIEGRTQQFAESDAHLKAEFLGTHPIPLGACLIRMEFLQRHGLRFDAEFDEGQGDLQFLAKCIAANAKLYAMPQIVWKLNSQPQAKTIPSTSAARQSALACKARVQAWQAFLPYWSTDDIAKVNQLYGALWPPDAEFASELVDLLARACTQGHANGHLEAGSLSRVMGLESLRVITVFNQAGLIDQAWMDRAYNHPHIAFLLSPISKQLPLQPTHQPIDEATR